MVQWLGRGTFTAVAWVQSLSRELRFCKSRGQKKKNGDLKYLPSEAGMKNKVKLGTL